MAYRDDRNWGDKISDIVEDALNSRDFERLNRNISNSIDDMFREWKIGPGTGRYQDPSGYNYRKPDRSYEEWKAQAGKRSTYSGTPMQDAVEHNYGYARNTAQGTFVPGPGAASQGRQKATPQLYTKQVPGTIAGPLCMVLGCIGVAAFGIGMLGTLAGGIISGQTAVIGPIVGLILAPFTAASGVLAGWGASLKNRANRFRSYVNVLSDRKYCEIAELAAAVDKNEKYVVKDLKKMIGDRFFYQGHLDRLETTLMVDDPTYQQYLQTEKSYQARLTAEAEQKKKDDRIFSTVGIDDPEFVKAIAEGNDYIREIREANEKIPGEEISKKLYRLEDVLKKIFLVLKQKPDQLGRLRKFMNYYMPTTRKLVQTYQELEAQPLQGENIRKAKEEIEQTLDTINDAYEKLLDSFYEDALMDVHTDRAVLESMLKQDGLGENPFEMNQVQQSH